MLELGELLRFEAGAGSLVPPVDAHIHVTDTLDASGAFVLLQYALDAAQHGVQVVWIGAAADGVMHLAHLARKAFVYLDASDTLDARALHALHTNLDEVLHASDASETQALVVIDSLSMLQWCLPGPADAVHWDLVQWLRAVRKLCASRAAALVTLLHADACAVTGAPWDQGDERLFRYLLRTADVWVAVRELPSGRAADCDGELSVHALARPAAAAAMGDQGSPHLRAFLLHRYLPAKTQFLYRVLPDGTGPKLENGMRALVRVWARGNNPGLL